MKFVLFPFFIFLPFLLFSQQADTSHHTLFKKKESPFELTVFAGSESGFEWIGLKAGMEISYTTMQYNRKRSGRRSMSYQLAAERNGASGYFLDNAFMYSLCNREYRTGPFSAYNYSFMDAGICISNNLDGKSYLGIGPQVQFKFIPFIKKTYAFQNRFSLAAGGKFLFPVFGNFADKSPAAVFIVLRYRVSKIPQGAIY